jgi:hypothetical protein
LVLLLLLPLLWVLQLPSASLVQQEGCVLELLLMHPLLQHLSPLPLLLLPAGLHMPRMLRSCC